MKSSRMTPAERQRLWAQLALALPAPAIGAAALALTPGQGGGSGAAQPWIDALSDALALATIAFGALWWCGWALALAHWGLLRLAGRRYSAPGGVPGRLLRIMGATALLGSLGAGAASAAASPSTAAAHISVGVLAPAGAPLSMATIPSTEAATVTRPPSPAWPLEEELEGEGSSDSVQPSAPSASSPDTAPQPSAPAPDAGDTDGSTPSGTPAPDPSEPPAIRPADPSTTATTPHPSTERTPPAPTPTPQDQQRRPAPSGPSVPGTAPSAASPGSSDDTSAQDPTAPEERARGYSAPRESAELPRAMGGGEQRADAVIVVSGDSLWAIAARSLGSRASAADIAREWPRWYQLNRDVIGPDPDRLLPGQRLFAPQ